MNHELINKLRELKPILCEQYGIKEFAVFGSVAKGTDTKDSDIDLLYDIEPIFIQKYSGFEAFSKLNEIKESLQKVLNTKVDIASIDNNSKTFKKYALKDVIYV